MALCSLSKEARRLIGGERHAKHAPRVPQGGRREQKQRVAPAVAWRLRRDTGADRGLSDHCAFVGAQDPGPPVSFAVFVGPNFTTTQVGGFFFTPGSQLTLVVDNGNNGTDDYQTTKTVPAEGNATTFPAEGNFTVAEGDLVRLSDDQTPQTVKETIVQYMTLSVVDVGTEMIAGTARPGTHLFIYAGGPAYQQIAEVIADSSASGMPGRLRSRARHQRLRPDRRRRRRCHPNQLAGALPRQYRPDD